MKHASRDHTSHSEIVLNDAAEVKVNSKTQTQIKTEWQTSILYLYD